MRRSSPLSNSVFQKFYTGGEEIMNSVTHGVGVLLSIAGLVLNVVFGVLSGDPWKFAGGLTFGITLILLFTCSTLYHAITNQRAKAVLRVLDHTSIFLLIAGTYTPITLVTLRGPVGWTIFAVVWSAAILGVVLNAVSIERFKVFSMICYVAMGWCVVFAFPPLFRALARPGIYLLIAGGVCYTGGIVFYALRRRYMHGIWHLFVLAGAVCHYLCVLLYVIL
ncbi:PAQR family membrane homeostasis protein TrhA [Beduinella massiliensis]|uniref:PAQR family membrane homeostasis protein TrhA n=1 Tax=Beduinella massiliensis TaxID=1852363 RepID=UPI000C86676E